MFKEIYLSPSLLTRRYAFVQAEGSPRFLRNSAAAAILVSSSFSALSAQEGSLHHFTQSIAIRSGEYLFDPTKIRGQEKK